MVHALKKTPGATVKKKIMKTRNLKFIAAAVGLLLAAQLHAQTVRYTSATGNSVKIEGTAGIAGVKHDWVMESKLFGGSLEIDPGFDADFSKAPKTIKADVIMPVKQFKSDKIEMNNVMYDAMKWDQFRIITNRVIALKPTAAGKFDATCEIIVAGVTRTNTFPVTFERVDKTKIKVTGSTPLKMTDFGVKPPVLVGITTGDDVKISFEWVVENKTAAPK